MKKKTAQPPSSLSIINPDAAGIDIGSEQILVAVPADRGPQRVRTFATFTTDLSALSTWLKQCRIKTVAMESTGIYWIPLFEILEADGFEVFLVNARHVKNVAGKKSDVLDCQWLQQLHSFGLLAASFRPPEEICALRALVRHRDNLLHYRAAHIQHMQKALHQMNIQLDNVISDITGTTGLQIIRAILSGERERASAQPVPRPALPINRRDYCQVSRWQLPCRTSVRVAPSSRTLRLLHRADTLL